MSYKKKEHLIENEVVFKLVPDDHSHMIDMDHMAHVRLIKQ